MKNLEEELKKAKNKTALVVFPHPDDESVMAGGLIRHLTTASWRVVVVCLTRGERGKIHINGEGRSSEEIRTAEFVTAMEVLGVTSFELFNFGDGQLRTKKRWQAVLADVIDTQRPELVISYDPSGITGHPDHVALAVWLLDHLRDARWKPKLWWPVLHGRGRELIVDKGVEDLLPSSSHRLELTLSEVTAKWRAIRAHRSQGWGKARIFWFLCLGWLLRHRHEEFVQADLVRQYPHRYVKFEF